MTPGTEAVVAPKAKKARTNFNTHAKGFLAREIGERIVRWKAARGAGEKKVVEDEVWAAARADDACGADAWSATSVGTFFHNFKTLA